MQETAQEIIRIVAIKFRTAGKQYDFNANGYDFNPGDRVIVETDRGRALGTVVHSPRDLPRLGAPDDLKSVLRFATEEDLALAAANVSREKEAFRFCLQRIQDRKMEMKLVRAEYLFDGSKIVFYFTADGRIDFRELVKDLAHYFHTRIEMRQIGVRDEAKLIGGLGICGRELCCCTFLTDFTPVSVKMAKEQGLALNPNKISGQCGRLLCCLSYEYETYCAMKKALPKCGKKVQVAGMEAEVVDQNILAQTVTLVLDDGQTKELTPVQIEQGEVPPVPPPSRGEERGAESRPKRQRSPRSKPRPQGNETSTRENARPVPPPRSAPVEPPQTREGGPESAPREGKKRNRNRRRPRRN